jgi:hypothetical protein
VHNRPNASVWDNYEEVKVIGHGMTGRVYMVQHKGTKEKYALKVRERERGEGDGKHRVVFLATWRAAAPAGPGLEEYKCQTHPPRRIFPLPALFPPPVAVHGG